MDAYISTKLNISRELDIYVSRDDDLAYSG